MPVISAVLAIAASPSLEKELIEQAGSARSLRGIAQIGYFPDWATLHASNTGGRMGPRRRQCYRSLRQATRFRGASHLINASVEKEGSTANLLVTNFVHRRSPAPALVEAIRTVENNAVLRSHIPISVHDAGRNDDEHGPIDAHQLDLAHAAAG